MIIQRHKTVSKVLIHAIFWVSYILVIYAFDCMYDSEPSLHWYDKIHLDLLAWVLSISYFNDFVLLPYFSKRKSYLIYTIVVVAMVLLATLFHCYIKCSDSILLCFSIDIWIIAIPVISISLIWMISKFLEKQKELEQLHQDRIELELKYLKQQINPHVLFNSLNTIYAKAIDENDEIAEMVLMLSENLKYVLNQSDSKLVNLEKDITFIENYLEFQKLRTQGIIKINYIKNIDSYSHSIAPLILIDLIENAFKYSPYKNEGESIIEIYLEVKKGKLKFHCKNDYESIIPSKNKSTTRIGLKNLKQRLNLLYPDKYHLGVSQKEGKFLLDLNINLQ